MHRLLSWIANVVSVAFGGPASVDAADPGLTPSPADHAAPLWAMRAAVLAPVAVIVLALIGLPWPAVAVVAALLVLPLTSSRVQALRRN